MKLIPSLPAYAEFKQLLQDRLKEVSEGFDKNDIVISAATYNDAMLTYSEEDREDLINFVKDNNLTLSNPFTGSDTWTRFEEYHTPSLLKETDIKPYRRNKDSNVYWVRAIKDIKLSMLHGNYLKVLTGYRLVVPKNSVVLVGTCVPGIAVINPVIPAMSLREEFYVELMHTTNEFTEVKKGSPYIYVAVIPAITLMSDNVFKEKIIDM